MYVRTRAGVLTHRQAAKVPSTSSEVAVDLECNKEQSKSIQHSQSNLEGKTWGSHYEGAIED